MLRDALIIQAEAFSRLDRLVEADALFRAHGLPLQVVDRRAKDCRELERRGQLDRALEFLPDDSVEELSLSGTEEFAIEGLASALAGEFEKGMEVMVRARAGSPAWVAALSMISVVRAARTSLTGWVRILCFIALTPFIG